MCYPSNLAQERGLGRHWRRNWTEPREGASLVSPRLLFHSYFNSQPLGNSVLSPYMRPHAETDTQRCGLAKPDRGAGDRYVSKEDTPNGNVGLCAVVQNEIRNHFPWDVKDAAYCSTVPYSYCALPCRERSLFCSVVYESNGHSWFQLCQPIRDEKNVS